MSIKTVMSNLKSEWSIINLLFVVLEIQEFEFPKNSSFSDDSVGTPNCSVIFFCVFDEIYSFLVNYYNGQFYMFGTALSLVH